MKFLQIHTFYPEYLRELYARNSLLSVQPFLSQINVLIQDGFSASHLIAPHMQNFGYDSGLIIANCQISQAQWMSEHQITLRDSQNWLHEIVYNQVEHYRPDVLYLSDPITFDSRFVRELTYKPHMVLGWRASTIPPATDWSAFDVILSNVRGCLQEALQRGARKVEYFMPGFPAFLAEAVTDEAKQWDVVFSGQLLESLHRERREFVKKVVDASTSERGRGFSVGLYSVESAPCSLPENLARINHGPRWGLEMHRVLKRGRIVLNPICTNLFGSADHINMRHLEVTGTGSFMLTNEHESIKKYFVPGVEIETFRDENELLEKVYYYLLHADKREEIARRGQQRCLQNYSMAKRAAEMHSIIRNHDKGVAMDFTKTPSVKELMHQAAQFIGKDQIQAAFDLLVKAKALKEPLEGLDVLRAQCFMKMGQLQAAVEALREEVRWFPDNHDAAEMLDSLQAQMPDRLMYTGDEEFDRVLEIIRPYTMLSEQRLCSLYNLARHACENNIHGNFVECGVAAGGSSALLAWVIKKYSIHPRRLFSFDSFSGMPRPTESDSSGGIDAESTGWGTGTCSAPEASVWEICAKLGVEDVLTTVKGYFEETLPQMRDWVGMIALLHMDGDWYESTRAILNNLYDRLTNGALIQVDDYGHWEGCRKAIHEFAAVYALQPEINQIDGTGVWFVKPNSFRINQEISKELVDDFLKDDPVPIGIVSQMSANERFQLYFAVRTLLPTRREPLRFIEIGSYSGASLVLTCQALQRLGLSYQGISVEPGGTSQFHEVIEILKQNVIHLPLFSHDASLRLGMMFETDKLPEFIFVDGDHSYEGVRQDIIDYYKLLAPGGIMLFHDYLPELDDINGAAIRYHHGNVEPGIRRACEEVLEVSYRLSPLELPLLYPDDPTQTQAHLPIIPSVFSTVRAYRKPLS